MLSEVVSRLEYVVHFPLFHRVNNNDDKKKSIMKFCLMQLKVFGKTFSFFLGGNKKKYCYARGGENVPQVS